MKALECSQHFSYCKPMGEYFRHSRADNSSVQTLWLSLLPAKMMKDLRKTMSPNHLPLSATLKIMVLSYGDHLSNNILWAEMVIGRNGYGQKWAWTKMVMGRNNRNLYII